MPERGSAAGFRFGGFPSASADAGAGPKGQRAAGRGLSGPEAEVTASLTTALAAGGQEAGRHALKRLLLRWHPDKAMHGDGPEAADAQAEATRVLRFILQERERLGL